MKNNIIKKFINQMESIIYIYKSQYFNKDWYIKEYSDLKLYKMFPVIHYSIHGWKEGRNPGPTFNTFDYEQINQDIKQQHINPLYHYEKYGKKENRQIYLSKPSKSMKNNNQNSNNNQLIENNYHTIKNSKLFDMQWYMNSYLYLHPKISPVVNFSTSYYDKNPGPSFYGSEYQDLNKDIKNTEPFLHYELIGKYENRSISYADEKMQHNTNNIHNIYHIHTLNNRKQYNNKLVTILSIALSETNKYTDIELVKYMNKVSDFLIIVVNQNENINILNRFNLYCDIIIFTSECNFHFNSYKLGYNYLINNKVLDTVDNLLFINNEIIGPLINEHLFRELIKSNIYDLFGINIKLFSDYIEPYFLLFKSSIFNSNTFKIFIENITDTSSSANNYYYNGMLLNYTLKQDNFKYGTFLDNEMLKNCNFDNLRVLPPFLSKSLYIYLNANNRNKLQKLIEATNDTFLDITQRQINNINCNLINKMTSKYNIYTNYTKQLKNIQRKFKNQEKINIVFLVNMASMFPGESLMETCMKNEIFNVLLYVIPDVRFGDKEKIRLYKETFNELSKKYTHVQHSIMLDSSDNILHMYDIIYNADFVCYSSPYNISYSLYNPYYAVQRNILSIIINYGYFRSKFDRYIYNLENYNNFWKVFLETTINYEEYKQYGQCDAANSVIVGYAKLDKLAQYTNNEINNKRKKIILAPHYSVNEKTNKMLLLSNFEKYANLFLKLPVLYPDIDFIFRPHPVLFITLKKPEQWGETKVNNYINKIKSYPNVTYSTEGDYLEIFANSDGIIQDSGSFLVEYFYTFKPCCYMLKSPNDIDDKFNELGVKCLEHVYIAYDETQITNFIEDVIINNNDYMKEDRIKFAKKEIMINYPHVSNKICKFLMDTLEGKND